MPKSSKLLYVKNHPIYLKYKVLCSFTNLIPNFRSLRERYIPKSRQRLWLFWASHPIDSGTYAVSTGECPGERHLKRLCAGPRINNTIWRPRGRGERAPGI